MMLQKWLVNHIKNEDGDYIEAASCFVVQANKASDGRLFRSPKKFFG